jgi:predicted metal-binding membrane protein
MSSTDHHLDHLAPGPAALGYALARPRTIAVASIVGLTVLGWLWLGLMNAQGSAALLTICRAQFGAGVWTGSEFFLVLTMWCAMVLAMMLPSAGPMILTYVEIADTAANRGRHVVSPFVLTSGYVTVWIGFALAAAGIHFVFSRSATVDPITAKILSGAIFIGAGLYQFSSLKQACLRLCRQPFQFFFVNWSTTPRGVFRLGVRQGIYCLGCCWAMMALMFAAGVMNVLWMAGVGIAMTAEKIARGKYLSRILGGMFIAIGAGFVLSAAGLF